MSSGKSFSGGISCDGDKKSFEDTVKNLLKMPHKPAKADEKTGPDEPDQSSQSTEGHSGD